jgi:hypothetical protein
MRPVSGFWMLPLAAALAATIAGCQAHPTYPKDRLANSLQEILTADQLKTSVRVINHTLAIHLDYPDALSQSELQIGIGPAFDEAIRKVLMAVHRVLLSSDADIRFYVVLLSDPTSPGAYLTIVRYLDDVKRANANMIDTPEMFSRTIFELNYLSGTQLTLEQYVPRDIRLEEFLTWQLARRIQHTLADELQTPGVASVGRCGGQFNNGEFAFTLDVSPVTEKPLDEETLRKVFRTSTNVIAKVLSGYHFDSFNAVRLTHPLTGRDLVLPKTNLDVFR